DILIVDDDLSIAKAFEHFLRYEGHECRIASGVDDALRSITEQPPQLIMMDVRMPGVDGLHGLEQIHALYPRLAVVIMTAYGASAVRAAARHARDERRARPRGVGMRIERAGGDRELPPRIVRGAEGHHAAPPAVPRAPRRHPAASTVFHPPLQCGVESDDL